MAFGIITISIGVLILFVMVRFAFYGVKPTERIDYCLSIGFTLFALTLVGVGSMSLFIQYNNPDDEVTYATNSNEVISSTSIE